MKKHEIEIFNAGTHTDSKGKTHVWTYKDLDDLVSAYKESRKQDAPIFRGHVDMESTDLSKEPSYGWIDSIHRNGKKLYAVIRNATDELVDWIKEHRFEDRSMAVKNGILHHLALTNLPAVKGMDRMDPAFAVGAEQDLTTYSYSAMADNGQNSDATGATNDDILAALTANNEKLDALTTAINNMVDSQKANGSSKPADGNTSASESDAELQRQFNELKDENTQLKAGMAAHNTQFAEMRIDAFLGRDDVKARLPLPWMRDAARRTLMSASKSTQTVSFSEGGTTKTISELDHQMNEIMKQPTVKNTEYLFKEGMGFSAEEQSELDKQIEINKTL